MAQTQTKSSKAKKRSAPKSARSSAKAKSKPKSSKSKSQSKPKAAKPKSSKAKPKSASSKSQSSNGSRSSSGNGSSGGSSPVDAVRNAVGGKAKSAGQTVGKAASKAKVPLVAGGAAIAGAAGGMALAASKGGRKHKGGIKAAMPRKPKIKIKSGDVAKAAKEVGNFSAQVGQLANELQRARESADGGNKHRSPVEVVLQGLTARR